MSNYNRYVSKNTDWYKYILLPIQIFFLFFKFKFIYFNWRLITLKIQKSENIGHVVSSTTNETN